MNKYLWLTDIHLNFLKTSARQEFFKTLKLKTSHGIFLSGDIATGSTVAELLKELGEYLNLPIYFVLGNHDLWNSSSAQVKRELAQLPSNLVYLSQSEPIALTEKVGLIGHDGFCDARWKEPKFPLVFLMDWCFIKDFRNLSLKEKYALMRDWASESATQVGLKLRKALETFEEVIMVSHFPLLPETNLSKWWEDFWKPYNSSKIMFETLTAIMQDYPKKKLKLLSGHSHQESIIEISHNILQKVGGVELGNPVIQEIIYV